MDAVKLLFGSDIGLLSVITIVFATVFVVYMYGYAKKKMDEDAKNAGK
jgi:ABC-type thiamin/hydroxymethylpyrimidine transport system permease subunit